MTARSLWVPVAAALFGAAVPASGVEMQIAPDRMAVVDGQRVFVLGLYENPKSDADLDRATRAGFNLVHSSPETSALDRLQAHGAWGWVNTGMAIDLPEGDAARREALLALADPLSAHPALAVWEVPDEALWNCWYIPTGWRAEQEPRLLAEKIEALKDRALAEDLSERLDEANALRGRAQYAESERLADSIWEALGEEPPSTGLNLSESPAKAEAMLQGMLRGYRALREFDSRRPVWMNHAPRNTMSDLTAFGEAADIVGCDIYPIPEGYSVRHSDLANRTPSSVGAYTQRMQTSAPGKPVWMVLQGFGWGDILPEAPEEERENLRRPTFDETRFMAYDAIVRGARGILYWGTAYIEKDSELWEDLLRLVAELHQLQPVLSAPDADIELTVSYAPTYGSVDRDVVLLPKHVGDKTWIIVVNEWEGPLTFTVSGLSALEGARFVDDASGEAAQVADGRITLPIPPYGVYVLRPE